MFTRHRHGPIDELDCPHALGTNAFSPQWAESFRHFLLLPSPHSTPSLRSVAQGRLRLLTADASRRIFESALERVRRSFRLQVYGDVVMPEHVHLLLSEPQRDTSSGRTAPLKPKAGLNGPPVRLHRQSSRPRFQRQHVAEHRLLQLRIDFIRDGHHVEQ
jgi:REP element-mobilizing transposase RayT